MIPAKALKKHIAILGMNGSGKTSVAKSQIIEPALEAGERVCNIDPTGVGWGLRLSATGKSKGFSIYIVGGDHADFPLFRRDGKAWGEIVGTSSDSYVFDTSQMTVEDRSQWFTDFAEMLIRKNKGPINLVLDEAHLFAPQAGARAGGIAPRMLHATNNLLALGRSKGLIVTMISQRPAKLHKDSLTQAHTLVAMALMAPQDRNAVKEWVVDQADAETGKQIIASLPSLKPGEGWVWAPKEGVLERVKFSRPRTFDSSSAPDDAGAVVKLSPINPEAIKARLAEVAKETIANDPAALKAEIARLRLEATKPAQNIPQNIPADPQAIEAAELRGFERAKAQLTAAAERQVRDAHLNILQVLRERLSPLDALLDEEIKRAKGIKAELARAVTFVPAPPAPRPMVVRSASAVKRAAPVDTERPLGAERKPLGVLAGVYPAGMTEAQWAVGAGLKRTGGTWAAYVSRLRSAGRIEERGDLFYATEQGIADLGGAITPLPPAGMDLVEYWVQRISGVGPMLRALAEQYPGWLSREDLAALLNLAASGGTFNAYLSRLRSPGLIEEDREKRLRASPVLMEGIAA